MQSAIARERRTRELRQYGVMKTAQSFSDPHTSGPDSVPLRDRRICVTPRRSLTATANRRHVRFGRHRSIIVSRKFATLLLTLSPPPSSIFSRGTESITYKTLRLRSDADDYHQLKAKSAIFRRSTCKQKDEVCLFSHATSNIKVSATTLRLRYYSDINALISCALLAIFLEKKL